MTDTNYNRDKIEQVVTLHNLDAVTADMLRLAHEIDVRQGIDGTVTYNNGASDFGDWMRRAVAALPYLVAKPSTAPDAETAPPAAPTTAADLMGEVRSGRMTASEAAASLLSAHGAKPTATRPAPAAPDTPTYADSSMTSLMAKVRAGDRSALTALTARYLNPTR